tara:strand:+ start:1575 stop:2384 length:810 start_codon:yes stop_codon:yes gene_type:complete
MTGQYASTQHNPSGMEEGYAAFGVACVMLPSILNTGRTDSLSVFVFGTFVLFAVARVCSRFVLQAYRLIGAVITINAIFVGINLWRLVGIACPHELRPWYCTETGNATTLYSDWSNAYITSVLWLLMTGGFVIFFMVNETDNFYYGPGFWRGLMGGFYIMYFVASTLPGHIEMKGHTGIVLGTAGGLLFAAAAKALGGWTKMQWIYVSCLGCGAVVRLLCGNHIHHAEWSWWLVPLSAGLSGGSIIAGGLIGVSMQELSGTGARDLWGW